MYKIQIINKKIYIIYSRIIKQTYKLHITEIKS